MNIGAHLSVNGKYEDVFKKLISMGASSLQFFSKNPLNWSPVSLPDAQINSFKEAVLKYKINPVYFHATYLINLALETPVGHLSKEVLKAELNLASKMGVRGSIVHLGSFKEKVLKTKEEEKDYSTLFKNINEILSKIPKDVFFIIENSGTRKIGLKMEEISFIIKELKDERLKVCLDTCHLHAAGFDLSSKENFNKFFEKFDQIIGLDRLELIHLNDSRDPFGSLRDRHENIGKGEVNKDVFKNILNDDRTKDLPLILETPGFSGEGPDRENIEALYNAL